MITEVIEQDTDLHRQRWVFGVSIEYSNTSPISVRLESWWDETRPTKRHKWQVQAVWYKRKHREREAYGYSAKVVSSPPLPPLLKDRARALTAMRIDVLVDVSQET